MAKSRSHTPHFLQKCGGGTGETYQQQNRWCKRRENDEEGRRWPRWIKHEGLGGGGGGGGLTCSGVQGGCGSEKAMF
jgi:hypothetical protein